jgi:hypothetical protein
MIKFVQCGELFEYTGCDKGTRRHLKCVMLATSKYTMAGTMSFARLTDAFAVTMERRSAQRSAFIVEKFLK